MADKKEEKEEKQSSEEKKETLKEKEPKKEENQTEIEIDEPSYESEPLLDPEPRKHPKNVDPRTVMLGVLIAVLIVIALFIFMEKRAAENTPVPVAEEKIELSPVAVKYSLEKYIEKDNQYEGTNIVVSGFLMHEMRAGGKTVMYNDYFVVDDYGNKILLNFVYLRNPNYFDDLFVQKGTTRDLFNVSGVYKKDTMQGYKLYVKTIIPTYREYVLQ